MARSPKRKAGAPDKAKARKGNGGNGVLPREEFAGKGVYIATPIIDGKPYQRFVNSIWGARQDMAANGIAHDFTTVDGDSLVTRARNVLTGHFLQSPGFTHLMFIDCDIEFHPSSIRMLLEDNLDIVAGIYPKKMDDEEYVLNFPRNGYSDFKNGCCVELMDVGTGFLMISRRVFERMMEAEAVEKIDSPMPSAVTDGIWPDFKQYYWNFFGERVIDREHLSEDYAFCRIWNQLGGKCYADVRINLNHVGQKVYPGRVWPYMRRRMDDETQEKTECRTPDKDIPSITQML